MRNNQATGFTGTNKMRNEAMTMLSFAAAAFIAGLCIYFIRHRAEPIPGWVYTVLAVTSGTLASSCFACRFKLRGNYGPSVNTRLELTTNILLSAAITVGLFWLLHILLHESFVPYWPWTAVSWLISALTWPPCPEQTLNFSE